MAIHSPVSQVKVVFAGDPRVGKTSIVIRHVNASFSPHQQSTISANYEPSEIQTASGDRVRLQLWDTAGQDQFKNYLPLYLRKANFAILVFDLTSGPSFNHLTDWIDNLRSAAPDNIPIFLVGNKSDLTGEREIGAEQAEAFVKASGIRRDRYFEASALTGQGINDLFQTVAEEALKLGAEVDQPGTPVERPPDVGSSYCC
jgi:small GTP-binding protein